MPKSNSTAGEHGIFATRLRGLMDKNNITHQELADKLGVSRQAVSWYYFGKRQPNFEKLIEISEFFDVSTDYLLGVSEFRNYDEIKEIKESTRIFEQIDNPYILEDMKEAFKNLGAIGKNIESYDISNQLKITTDSLNKIFLSYQESLKELSTNTSLSKIKYLEFKAFSTEKMDSVQESIKKMANEMANSIKNSLDNHDGETE